MTGAGAEIVIIGSGYVGLTYAAGFVLKGLQVALVDVDSEKVRKVNEGICPIDEPGLADAIASGVSSGRLAATTSLDEVFPGAMVFFICVGTYCDEKGNIDLRHVRSAARDIARCYAVTGQAGYKVVCVKSTVLCGTSDGVVLPIIENAGLKAGMDFGVAMSPEFLKEGSALEDILHPDKIVIGGLDERSSATVRRYLSVFAEQGTSIIETSLRTAELIKYAQNAFLATKISFINELSRFAELFGVNIDDVAHALGLDSRISPRFLNAGPGFGGSCFPKDVLALYSAGQGAGIDPIVLRAVLDGNERQKKHVVELLEREVPVQGGTFAILGISFKANTGDTREAVSRSVLPALLEKGAKKVRLHDPSTHARKELERDFPAGERVEYVDDARDALAGADACLVLTEWPQYATMDPVMFKELNEGGVVIDTRRILPAGELHALGIRLVQLGVSTRKDFVPG